MRRRISNIINIVIATLLLVLFLMNMYQMFTQLQEQAKEAGVSQLQSVSYELERTISEASSLTMEIAIKAREVLDDRNELIDYLIKQKAEIIKTDTGAFNVYAAGSDWFFIPDFAAPEDYVAQDRTWYKGAVRSGGRVYISSPYQDAMTGDICYTVSVMLGDGKSVVAVDYTMDTVQAYVEQIRDQKSKRVVIVTDDGIIAGSSDEGMIGEQLTTGVPEYAGIWSLARARKDYVTARIQDGILHENLFATKSGDDWIMIVSVSDWELYKSSYIQLIVTVLLLLAFIITTVLTAILARRNQKREGEDVLQRKEYSDSEKRKEGRGVNKRYRNLILAFMIVVMLISLYSIFSATYRWGNAQMKSEAERYENTLQEWIETQKSILDMFVSAISSNPEMLENYEETIAYLDGITEQFPEISVTYLANPDLQPTVFMNNGWMPEPDLVIEDRPWYAGAIMSKTGWSMTAPYYDTQTESYCVTISKQVHDARNGKFLGVFGIDFYMDKLIDILGASYSNNGYAFLVDVEGYIVNHPYGRYQMSPDSKTNVLELPYGKISKNVEDTKLIRDYDGSLMILLARVNETSQFSVYVLTRALLIYGRVILYGIICLAAFLLCIVMIYRLLSGMITWQDEVNRKLEKAAHTDAMTGLLNKASTEEAIGEAVKNASGALMLIDLDSFKLVNDLYSHEMGDRILVRFANLIQSVIRDNDISGRIGGDEFIIFLEGLLDVKTIEKKVDFLNTEIIRTAKELMGEDMEIPLGCSAGVTFVPKDGREYSSLFSKTDLALHQIKRNGKHKVQVYNDETADKTVEESGNLSNLQLIFGERNIEKSAKIADREQFQEIFQYMNRFAGVNNWDLHMVEFSLEGKDDKELSEATDKFIQLSAGLLRNFDVLLKYNDRQVVLLLMEPENKDYMIPVARILEAWDQKGVKGVTISYQHEQVSR
jgi:diguanylate cyclase (GGDEF)-like protein